MEIPTQSMDTNFYPNIELGGMGNGQFFPTFEAKVVVSAASVPLRQKNFKTSFRKLAARKLGQETDLRKIVSKLLNKNASYAGYIKPSFHMSGKSQTIGDVHDFRVGKQ